MIVDDFITYLQGQGLSFLTIELAYTMTPMDDLTSETPALFLYPGSDTAGENQFDNTVVQRVVREISCLIVCPYTMAEARIDELRDAAIGWQYNDYYDSLQLAQGRMLDVKAGVCWWSENYTTWTHLRQL